MSRPITTEDWVDFFPPTDEGGRPDQENPRTDLVLNHCRSSRLITHDQLEGSFNRAVERLTTTPRAVLISPRATEGIDLKVTDPSFKYSLKFRSRCGATRVSRNVNKSSAAGTH